MSRVGLIVVALALPPALGVAEEPRPRQAELVEKRKAKADRLEPYRPTWLERTLLAFEKAERPAVYEINLWGVHPRVRTIDHRSQWAAGARLWKPDVAGSTLDVSAATFWSVAGFRYHEAQAGLLPHRGRSMPLPATRTDDVFELPNVRGDDNRRLMLFASWAYRWAPKLDYWGLGGASREDARVAFRQEESLYEIVAGYRLARWLTVGARAGIDTVSLGPGRDDELPSIGALFTEETAPGLTAQPGFRRTGAWAVVDTRDIAGNPHRGGLAAALWTRCEDRDGGAWTFDRVAVDGRVYLPLGARQRVLALRAYLSQDDPATGARVPFYLQAPLGGSRTLRAYESQRFRAERLVLLQAEYRIEGAPAVEAALFADSGTVAARRGDPFGKLRTDWGVGLRLKSHETVVARLDAAWGGEGGKVALRFSPVF